MSVPKVIFLMADYGHDPTETAVPYTTFKAAGFDISFATENGKAPKCDSRMLEGITQKLLGATSSVVTKYASMSATPEFFSPLVWSTPDFSLRPYNLIFLPGGHEKSVRQLLDSSAIAAQLLDYFPLTEKPSGNAIGAVCHGVLALVNAKNAEGKSVIHDCKVTTLPARFEQAAYTSTRLFLGDYYKTYGAGSADVEADVRSCLDDAATQFEGSLNPGPFVVQDEKYNLVTARYPNDAQMMADQIVELVKGNMKFLEGLGKVSDAIERETGNPL